MHISISVLSKSWFIFPPPPSPIPESPITIWLGFGTSEDAQNGAFVVGVPGSIGLGVFDFGVDGTDLLLVFTAFDDLFLRLGLFRFNTWSFHFHNEHCPKEPFFPSHFRRSVNNDFLVTIFT